MRRILRLPIFYEMSPGHPVTLKAGTKLPLRVKTHIPEGYDPVPERTKNEAIQRKLKAS